MAAGLPAPIHHKQCDLSILPGIAVPRACHRIVGLTDRSDAEHLYRPPSSHVPSRSDKRREFALASRFEREILDLFGLYPADHPGLRRLTTVKSAASVAVPARAQYLRLVLLELERLYNHIADVGAICTDTGFAFANAHSMRLREDLLRLNQRLTSGCCAASWFLAA
jgi:hypothetical protein